MKSLSQKINESFESNSIINMIQELSMKFEVFHHNTRNYEQHKAFDEIQGSFGDLKDDLIEKLIGYAGDRYNSLQLNNIEFDDSTGLSLVNDLYALGQTLIQYSQSTGYVDLENTGQEIHGLGAKLNYLLTLK